MSLVTPHLLRHLGHLAAQHSSGPTDGELLERFQAARDEAAFELLVHRHGAMVYRVCRARSHCEADAEDVFQASFLALARTANRIRGRGSVAGWLYRVASRLASRLQARRERLVELPPILPAPD